MKRLIIIIIIIILLSGAIIFISVNKYRDERSEEQVSANEVSEFHEQSEYVSTKYGFSFQYPKDFKVSNFQEREDSNTILVQKTPSNSSGQVGFQIFISPFDEPGPLTKERILQDLPDLTIKNPEQRVLKNGAVALIFFSEEPSLGETREIWFIYNNYLYQISTYKELDGLVADILGTWKFQ